jgi:hypothetical protein
VREKASERTFPVIENAANLCWTFADAEEVPMTRYRGNVEAVRNLVRETEVHRDVYIDDEVFQLEMEHLFANTWIYVGHDSQVSKPGDYFGTTIGTQSVLMVRHIDNTEKVLHDRCPCAGLLVDANQWGQRAATLRSIRTA